MFEFKDRGGNAFQVSFRHHRKVKNGETVPKATTCLITNGDMPIAEALASPIGETLVVVSSVQNAYNRFGRRVKKIAKTIDGNFVVTLRGDNFRYATGREEAMTKALRIAFDRDDRALCWSAYKDALKKIVEKAAKQSEKDRSLEATMG